MTGGFAADLRRICGGFALAGRSQSRRRNGPDDAEKPAAQPAAGGYAGGHTGAGHPAGRAARRSRSTATGRIPEYPDTGTPAPPRTASGAASEAQAGRSGIRFGGIRFIGRSSENVGKIAEQPALSANLGADCSTCSLERRNGTRDLGSSMPPPLGFLSNVRRDRIGQNTGAVNYFQSKHDNR